MTTAGANPTGQKQDDIRTIFFGQDSINTNFNGQNNPFGNIITSYFPGVQQFARARLSLTNLALYNSWYNFTAARGNNTFQYVFPEGSSNVYTTHTVTLLDGAYETIEEVNDYLQAAMVKNGDYLIYWDKEEGTSTNTFYIELATSTIQYTYVLTLTPLPAVINANFPTDASASGYYAGTNVLTGSNALLLPQFIVPNTGAQAGTATPGQYSFSKSTGFTPGTFGSQGTSPLSTFSSNFAPQIQYSSVINIACNLVNMGDVNRNPNVFFQFVPDAAFGELVVVIPPYPVFVPVADSFYSYIQISLLDENLNPLQLNDPQIYGAVIVQG